jgi:dolichyl-phosphate-mannose-protein mannosyltransferase
MASEKATVSGLDSETQATRRRNVPSNAPNGGLVNRIEIDDKKTQVKKVSRQDACDSVLPTIY